ncbi:MAG: hypothetical protein JSW25_07545 [Thermoplasmata archaeon]|nr:MAG: hypothetical protein JSW25_07545 [Thermoplasmata archaeon]
MKRDAIRSYRTILVAANAIIAFLSLTNLFLVAAGAIHVEVPEADDLVYEYDATNQSLLVDTSFTVKNKGIYSVNHLNIDSVLVTHTGYTLVEYSQEGLKVSPGEVRTFPVSVDLDLRTLADPEVLRFLVEDGMFELHVKVRADYTLGLTEFRSDETILYPWEAPLKQLRDLLTEGNLSAAVEEALGLAGPALRGWISGIVLDASLAEGEWRHDNLGGWADLAYRLDIDEGTGNGTFDVNLTADLGGIHWNLNGTVPLRVIDGQVYLEREVISDVA